MSLVVAISLASLAAAPVPKADAAKDAKQGFQGEWKIVELVKGGNPTDKEDLADAKIVVKDDRMTIHFRSKVEDATYTLDSKAGPTAIDIKPQNDGDVLVKAIYKLEKDKLTICFGMGAGERPKEFKSQEDPKTGLFVLERVMK